jgi:hypothetical protein
MVERPEVLAAAAFYLARCSPAAEGGEAESPG